MAEGELSAAGVDRSTYSLIAANLFAAAIAVAFKMSLRDMVLVYWAQSIVIGLSFFIRMLNVKQYAVLAGHPESQQYVASGSNSRSQKLIYAIIFLLVFLLMHANT